MATPVIAVHIVPVSRSRSFERDPPFFPNASKVSSRSPARDSYRTPVFEAPVEHDHYAHATHCVVDNALLGQSSQRVRLGVPGEIDSDDEGLGLESVVFDALADHTRFRAGVVAGVPVMRWYWPRLSRTRVSG